MCDCDVRGRQRVALWTAEDWVEDLRRKGIVDGDVRWPVGEVVEQELPLDA